MLRPIEFRFTDSDRARFGCAEWLPFHVDAFVDVPLSVLRVWDATVQEAIGVKLFALLRGGGGVDLGDMETIAVAAWLALKVAKPDAPPFADFDPQLIGMTKRLAVETPAGGDADPPAPSSAEASAETPRPAKQKRSRPAATSKR